MTQPSLLDPRLFDLNPTPAKPNPVKAERQRLNAAARRVLERLKLGPALNWELCTPEIGGLRAIGRIHEIKKDGWLVTKQHVSGGIWRYTLTNGKLPPW